MLWVVRMTAVFPRLVDRRDITSHMNRLAIGSIPTIISAATFLHENEQVHDFGNTIDEEHCKRHKLLT